MGIEYKCINMEKKEESCPGKTAISFFCKLKGKQIRTCSGCKKKTVE